MESLTGSATVGSGVIEVPNYFPGDTEKRRSYDPVRSSVECETHCDLLFTWTESAQNVAVESVKEVKTKVCFMCSNLES